MSVRLSLLAILDEGPCYGYQLRAEYEQRTGARGLNVGQIYTTLERLERDGLVTRAGADERGHVYWAITDVGSGEVSAWFAAPDPRATRDDLVHKIALAASLPGADAPAIVGAQLAAARARRAALSSEPAGVRERILHAAERARAEADVVWLEAALAAVAGDPASRTFGLSEERPRRGRPARA